MILRIRDVERATPRAKLVRLEIGDAPFAYAAGQAILLAPEGQTERRPYSIASAPEDAKRSGVIDLLVSFPWGSAPDPGSVARGDPDAPLRSLRGRAVRSVTDSGSADWTFDPTPGALVDVEGPFGSFTFPDAPVERRFLFVAGGTGIAPLRAMLRHALGIPHDRIALFYSARTPDEFAFAGEFRALADAGAVDLRMTVTRDSGGAWIGARGRLSAELVSPLVAGGDTLSFVCGPASMVAEIPKLLQQVGVRPELIRIEDW